MEKKNKKKLYLIIAILGSVLILSGVSYAILTLVLTGTSENVVFAGNLMLVLDETETINIASAVPISDEEGKLSDAYVFSVENTGTIEAGYTIYLDEGVAGAGETLVDGTSIRYELLVNGTCSDMGNLSVGSTSLFIDNIKPGVTTNFELRLWIDYAVTSLPNNGIHKSSLRIVASQNLLDVSSGACSTGKEVPTEDDTLGCTDIPSYGGAPNPPELIGDMIPVVYDETQSEWVKADTSSEWYSYIEWEWANAVTVTETNRATLVASAPGTVIPNADINGMFVWIPRYSYTIGNTYGRAGCSGTVPTSAEKPGAFDVKWVTADTTDLGTAAYTGDTADNWFTNSAFCWGNSCDDPATRTNSENSEVSGLWVSKYEVSTSDEVCMSFRNDTNCNKELIPIVNTNSKIWNYNSIANYFNSIRTYMNGINGADIYGFSGNNYDAHMIKNTEWGAVAYLSQSKYGKYGNVTKSNTGSLIYPDMFKEVGQVIGEDYENSNFDIGSSTTGTEYGVYGMSGSVYDYVMANMSDNLGNFTLSQSNFLVAPEAKYYNKYVYSSDLTDLSRSILGDATREVNNFYNDIVYLMMDPLSFLARGGSGVLSDRGEIGIFTSMIDAAYGSGGRGIGTRSVITP